LKLAMAFFPSQVVEYIDLQFPGAKAGSEGLDIGFGQSAGVGALVTMLEQIPSHLLTLRPPEAAEYLEAVYKLQVALSIWKGGGQNYSVDALVNRGNVHPISIVRKHMASLKDEGPSESAPSLGFVSAQDLRDSLRSDLTAVDSALGNGEWKAATVLAGSVVEALLLDALQHRTAHNAVLNMAKRLRSTKILSKEPPSDLSKWDLFTMTEVCFGLGLISENTASQCRIAREFRNLIHPGKQQRLQQTCDRATALAAVAAAEMVARELEKPSLEKANSGRSRSR